MINSELELKDVLYVPKYKHSLLSVSKILNDYRIAAYFSAYGFLLQDLISKKSLAEGRQIGGLYKLEVHKAQGYQFSKSLRKGHTTIVLLKETS